MKVLASSLVLTGAFLLSGLFHAHSAEAAVLNSNVKVQINDRLVSFPDAQPFIDGNQNLQTPIRLISEELGYNVDWQMDGQQVTVTISSPEKKIVITTGQSYATVNGEKVSIGTQALFQAGRVMVPLRFVSENLGITTQWDQTNYIAILGKDGKYHAPAWWAPSKMVEKAISTRIAELSKQYLGTAYQYGGTSPDGFDCSGFVQYVYGQNGVLLPRTSSDMNAAGDPVSQPKVGDLVFFAQAKVTSHVGIYLGNNQFISATNDGVKIDSLQSGYWGSKYIGAKRFI